MTHFIKEEFKKWSTRSLFMAMAVMAVTMSPAGDNVRDIWNSPQRLTAIEAEIDEINELLSIVELDENGAIALVNP